MKPQLSKHVKIQLKDGGEYTGYFLEAVDSNYVFLTGKHQVIIGKDELAAVEPAGLSETQEFFKILA